MKEQVDDPAALGRARLTEALVRAGANDQAAFRTVYLLTSAKLFGICHRICRDRQAAEDVMHEVYLLAWKRAAAFEPGRGSPITWLATIARNRSIDWVRANGRRPAAALSEARAVIDPAPMADASLVAEERLAELEECLEELDARQHAAIRAAFFDGLHYAELAERERVPLGTMKSWVRRGLLKLRDCLRDGD